MFHLPLKILTNQWLSSVVTNSCDTDNFLLIPLVLRGRPLGRSFPGLQFSHWWGTACNIHTFVWNKAGGTAELRMTRMCQGRPLLGCTSNHSLSWWPLVYKLPDCSRHQTGQTGCRIGLSGGWQKAKHSSTKQTPSWLKLKRKIQVKSFKAFCMKRLVIWPFFGIAFLPLLTG